MARRGKANLEQQMRSAVFGAFREGMDKRSAKMQGADLMEKKIYSYASRNQLLDRIHDFVGTMKDDLRQEGIRKREELRPEHVEKYAGGAGDRNPEEIGQPRGGIGYEPGRSG